MLKLSEDRVLITVAVTGSFATKETYPNAPLQPDEIAESTYACYNEGAAIVHLHARDKEGKPTISATVYSEIHQRIRAKCNIILQDTTGAGVVVIKDSPDSSPHVSRDQRIECLNADPRPEMASLNMGTMLRTLGPFAGVPWMNSREEIEYLAGRMKALGVKPEMEVYHPGMLRELRNLIDKDLLEKPYYVDLVFGMAYQGAIDANPRYLMLYLDLSLDDVLFNCLAIGPNQNPLTTMGMLFGGCIRVGLEDNLYYRKGEPATNQQLVARAVRIARELGKEPVSPEEARQVLGLKPI
jgi:3-keto-5-aminohexanoate cleavage enzyme